MTNTNAAVPYNDRPGDRAGRPDAGPADRGDRRTGGGWVIGFLLTTFCLQVGLFFLGGSAVLRLPLRVGVYGLSVAFLFLVPGRNRPHPAWLWSQAAIGILLVGMINPTGDSWVARLATVVLYASVLAPLLWAGRLDLRVRDLRIVLRVMWAFYAASATMGVLQVNYPGRFDGSLAANFADRTAVSYQMHVMELADGHKVIRPMGLTDTPGGAGAGGVNAIILGTGLLLTETSLILRALVVAGMVAGLFCIYIVQERVNLVIVGLATVVILAALARRGSVAKALTLCAVAAGVILVGTTLAFAIGGATVSDRFSTLVANDAATVYQENRGSFLEEVVNRDVFDYPFGAGEGRWGMVNTYFGSPGQSLWAEMFWQSAVFDGGVPLILAYAGLFASLIWTAWRVATTSGSEKVACWGAAVAGYNMAALAASFVFPIMAVQIGIEVVLLNACLYAISRSTNERNNGGLPTWRRPGESERPLPASSLDPVAHG